MENERLVSPEKLHEDEQSAGAPVSLRPNSLKDFVGQPLVCENLKVFIEAAKKRGEALDHVLLFGPPGLGKTTLASIIAKELGVGFRATSAPMISKSGDLAAILTNLERNDVLFIDEIHRLNPAIEEVLYSAMEDFQLDLIIGEGPSARSVRIDLQPFTLVGATTRSGLLTTPLRERFGIPLRLDFYSPEELKKSLSAERICWVCRFPTTGQWKWPNVRGARRAWPGACYVGCAISGRWPMRARLTIKLPIRLCAGLMLTNTGLMRLTAVICNVLRSITAAGRSVRIRWRQLCRRSGIRLKK